MLICAGVEDIAELQAGRHAIMTKQFERWSGDVASERLSRAASPNVLGCYVNAEVVSALA
jgi:hypothetical protein